MATKRYGGITVMGAAGLAAACAAALALVAGSLDLLLTAQALAGVAWAGVLMSAFAAALALGHTGQEGRFSGALSSVLAGTTLLRMGAVAAGAAAWPAAAAPRLALSWAPVGMWAVAGSLLLWLWSRHGRPRVRGSEPTGAAGAA